MPGELIRPIVIEGGALTQRQLDQLRARLGLLEDGRLEDSEDVDFGTRWLREGAGRSIALSLQRDDAYGWPGGYCSSSIFSFTLFCQGEDPPSEWIDYWRFQILEAIADAGLRAAYKGLEPKERSQGRKRSQGTGLEDKARSLIQNNQALARIARDLIGLLEYAICIETSPSGPETKGRGEELPPGSSKLGGLPDLPPGVAWPELQGQPLPLVAQIRLADLIPYDQASRLPHTGMLSFFCTKEHITLDVLLKDVIRTRDPFKIQQVIDEAQQWQVIYTKESDLARLRRRPLPLKAHEVFPVCPLEFFTRLTLPPLESFPLKKLGLSYDAFRPGAPRQQRKEADAYMVLVEQLNDLYEMGRPAHQLLGNPDQFPADLRFPYSSPGDFQEKCANAADYQAEPAEWQLLLQIDAEVLRSDPRINSCHAFETHVRSHPIHAQE